jgi:hypothetical protein
MSRWTETMAWARVLTTLALDTPDSSQIMGGGPCSF